MALDRKKNPAVTMAVVVQQETNVADDRSGKHCIIGAGFTGLAMAQALKRHGIPYDQLEADDAIGGNWDHGVYETVHIISSRKTTEYGDFPMPSDWPDFPSAQQMLEYLNRYADHFQLREHLSFNTEVTWIEPAAGDKWEVTLKSGEKRLYGGVLICNGHHWDCRYPSYPGAFTGEVMHSKQYKNPTILKGKRVLVVGAGNSGCDIAVEAARFGVASHISLRRGIWIMPQTIAGIPTVEFLQPWMRGWLQSVSMKLLLRIFVGKMSRYGLQEPDFPIFERHPTINSQLLYYLKHGRITPHRDVTRLEGNRVEFVDGETVEVDLLVYATGFNVSIPFLAPGVIEWKEGYPDTIQGIFPQRHKNLYVVGIGQPRYGAGPLLTVGAEALAQSILVQPKLKRPLGAVLKKLGRKPLESYLMDPHEAMRNARKMARNAGRLPLMERWFFRNDS
ncbi:MAG TPA: NAD(P)-binding domain-containing protein [Candidatus Hydrogenedentes bacterium]|nr:NAD(P)-binding domain-containing protein [Candidatus Hydrogenedentota bacterium]